MTSFGRSQNVENENAMISVEMKSVNNRYLDINVKMPKCISLLEEKIKSRISEKIKRGKVDVFITYVNNSSNGNTCIVDLNLAKSYYECLKKIKDELNVIDDISASKLASFPDVIKLQPKEENSDELEKILFPVLDEALNSMIDMREKEGAKLKEDILLKLNKIEENNFTIEKLAADFPVNYKKKLEERIKELTSNMTLDENRIMTEVAIFADKSAIDEEIIRLKSHINQMRLSLELDEPVGRKLDFIIQEMNREINTMGSKSCSTELSNLVIECKNIIEKIREQVQNIE